MSVDRLRHIYRVSIRAALAAEFTLTRVFNLPVQELARIRSEEESNLESVVSNG